MLACDKTATLVRLEGERYSCTALKGVSWFAKTVAAVSTDGAKPVNILKVRIPENVMPEGVIPRPGDFLVLGVLEAMERPADLLGREYFQVTAVGDNRRGGLRHWSVSGA